MPKTFTRQMFGKARRTRAEDAWSGKSRAPRGSRRNAPDRIRTCDLRFRRPTLYPAELLARVLRIAVPWGNRDAGSGILGAGEGPGGVHATSAPSLSPRAAP